MENSAHRRDLFSHTQPERAETRFRSVPVFALIRRPIRRPASVPWPALPKVERSARAQRWESAVASSRIILFVLMRFE